jgi:serine/threonine protein kinase
MAPEQATGQVVDARADLFSLGCVLYQLATRQRPFAGASFITVLSALVNRQPPSPKDVSPDTPAELSALIMRLLSKAPSARPQTATEVAAEMHAIEQALDNCPATSIGRKPALISESEIPLWAGMGIAVAAASTILVRVEAINGTRANPPCACCLSTSALRAE